jgi:hypothetical protein
MLIESLLQLVMQRPEFGYAGFDQLELFLQ